ncbi:MAG: HEAT repeat domain-containing protein [Candidatus Latescibacterota bacterium]|jgi:hypothetical protein
MNHGRWWLLVFLGLPVTSSAQDPHIQRLGQELHSSDAGIRRQAAIALGRVSFPQSALLLRQALPQERDVAIRLEIVRGLRNIVFMRYPGYPEALIGLGEAAGSGVEPDELVRLRATEALWEAAEKDLLDPIPFLRRNLADTGQRLRLSAVAMLRKLGTPRTVDPLGEAALDPTQPEAVRLAAVKALGAVSLADPGPAGQAVVRANLRTTALLGLPALQDSASLEQRHARQIAYLAQLARDPASNATLTLQAVRSIGQVKHKSAIPVLRELAASHRDPAIRKQATRVLSHVLARQYE